MGDSAKATPPVRTSVAFGAQEGLRVIGISEYLLSTDVSETLVTYALGSCLGVTMLDREAGVSGMIHCMLPLSKKNVEKARTTPAMYVDTGILTLLNELYELGAQKDRLEIRVAGGACPMDPGKRFRIGERNLTVLRKILWKNELMIAAEDVGGTIPRTMRLYMESGRVTVTSSGTENDL